MVGVAEWLGTGLWHQAGNRNVGSIPTVYPKKFERWMGSAWLTSRFD